MSTDKPVSIREATEISDALCQEQVGDLITEEAGRVAIERHKVPAEELVDYSLERAKEIVVEREGLVLVAATGFSSGFLAGVIYARAEASTEGEPA